VLDDLLGHLSEVAQISEALAPQSALLEDHEVALQGPRRLGHLTFDRDQLLVEPGVPSSA
jgi:hypothetical protein